MDRGKNTLRKWMNSLCVPKVRRCLPAGNVTLSVTSTTRWSREFAWEKRSAPTAMYVPAELPPTKISGWLLTGGRLSEIVVRPTISSLDKLRSEEHTSELQSRFDLVCRLLLEKKNAHAKRTIWFPSKIITANVESIR